MYFAKVARALLAVVMTVSPVLQAAAQDSIFFRYRPGGNITRAAKPPVLEVDISARFMGMVGFAFDSTIPVKAGHPVAKWSILSGSLPQGLEFDEATGRIHGTPTEVSTARGLSVAGLNGKGKIEAYAEVSIDIIAARSNATRQEFYARTGKEFRLSIAKPANQSVARWEPLDLPAFASVAGGDITGISPQAGVQTVALNGYDHEDNLVAFTFGQILTEDGPSIAFIEDQVKSKDSVIRVNPSVARAVGDLRWEVVGGQLLPGLTFDFRRGSITGSVSTFATVGSFRLKATDVDGTYGFSNEFQIGSLPAPVSFDAIPDMSFNIGQSVMVEIDASEIGEGAQWDVAEGRLPAGIELGSAQISGLAASAAHEQGIVLRAISVDGTERQSNPFSIQVHTESFHATAQPVHARVGQAFESRPFKVEGGVPPYEFSLADGAQLPEGVALDVQRGVLTGSLSQPGNLSAALVVKDSTGRSSAPFVAGLNGYTAPSITMESEYTVTRLTAVAPSIAPQIAEFSLIPNAVWTLEGGALPEGLSLLPSRGDITGTPTALGRFGPYRLSVTDGAGETATSQEFHIQVNDLPDMIASASDVEIQRGIAVLSQIVSAKHAVGEVTYSLADESDPLPSGLVIDRSGLLKGRTTQVSAAQGIVVKAVDAEGREATTKPFSITLIEPSPLAGSSMEFEWTVGIALETGKANIHNPAGDMEFEAISELPAWLHLDKQTGAFSGTAPSIGFYGPYELSVVDEMGRSTTITAQFDIKPPMSASVPASVKVARLADFTPGLVPTVENAISPVSWSTAGKLPEGLFFDSMTGTISGQPLREGRWPVSLSLVDAAGQSAVMSTTLEIGPRGALSAAYPQMKLTLGSSGSLPAIPSVQNGAKPLSFTLEGDLPTGMSFSKSDGSFSGMPSRKGYWEGLKVSVRDAEGYSTQTVVDVLVAPTGGLEVAETVTRQVRAGESFTTPAITLPGGVKPYRFTLSQGSSLQGLSLDGETGAISGLIPESGIRTIALDVKDITERTAKLNLVINAVGALDAVSSGITVQQHEGLSGAQQIQVSNAVGSVSYELKTTEALPLGVTFDAAKGQFTGKAIAAPGVYGPYTVQVKDASQTVLVPVTINVSPRAPLEISFPNVAAKLHSTLPEGLAPAVKNAGPDLSFALSGPALPQGLTFDKATGGIKGTPTAEGTFGPYTLTATDIYTSGSVQFSISVGPREALKIEFGKTSNAALAHHDFALTPEIGNAVGKVTVSIASGNLPTGLSINSETGQIFGRPTNTGFFRDIVLRAVDTASGVALSTPITIEVVLDGNPVSMVTTDLQTKVGLLFSTQKPAVSNEIGDYFFMSPQAEALGLSVDPLNGVISGRLQSQGKRFIDLSVTDMTNRVSSTPQVIDVVPSMRLSVPSEVYAMVNRPFPVVVPNIDYAIGSVSFSPAQPLPAGLVLNNETGEISGTPTAIGRTDNLQLEGVDSVGDRQVTNSFVIEIVDDGSIPSVSMADLPELRVGQAMQPVRPTVTYGKTGDSFSLNKPLPAGLVLDAATGEISGTPASGSHGLHKGYVMSVRDVTGKGTQSALFAIPIRHQDTPTFSVAVPEIRSGIAFTTGAVVISNAHAVIGSVRFEPVSASGVTIDQSTGRISGTINSSRSVRLKVVDSIGQVGAAFDVGLVVTALSASLPAEQVIEAGQQANVPATVTGAVGPNTVYELEYQHETAEGLYFDPSSRSIRGSMPYGTYHVRLKVVDNGQTAFAPSSSGWTKVRGVNSQPLNLVFSTLTKQQHGAQVVSEVRPISGVPDNTPVTYSSLDGGAGEYRICYTLDCSRVKYDWDTQSKPIFGGEFVQLRATVANGSEEVRRHRLSFGAAGSGEWSIISDERVGIADASKTLPSKAEFNGAEVDWKPLYDGSSKDHVTITQTVPLTVTFENEVSFSSYHILKQNKSTSGHLHYLWILTPQGWVKIHQNVGEGTFTLPTTYTAKSVRLFGYTSSNSVREFRLGAGPVYLPPAPGINGNLGYLADTPTEYQLAATINSDYPPYQATWEWVTPAGARPPKVGLTSDGLLSLPAASELPLGGWGAQVRVTDGVGQSAVVDFSFYNRDKSARQVYPSSITIDGMPASVTNAYDASTSTTLTVQKNKELIISFDEVVSVDTLMLNVNISAWHNIFVERNGEWVNVVRQSTSANVNRDVTVKAESKGVAARRFKIVPEADVTYRTLRLGDGGQYPPYL